MYTMIFLMYVIIMVFMVSGSNNPNDFFFITKFTTNYLRRVRGDSNIQVAEVSANSFLQEEPGLSVDQERQQPTNDFDNYLTPLTDTIQEKHTLEMSFGLANIEGEVEENEDEEEEKHLHEDDILKLEIGTKWMCKYSFDNYQPCTIIAEDTLIPGTWNIEWDDSSLIDHRHRRAPIDFQPMPVVTIDSQNLAPLCDICYDEFPVLVQPPCGHKLCAWCLQMINNTDGGKKCPMCRKEYSTHLSGYREFIYDLPDPLPELTKLQYVLPYVCKHTDIVTVRKWMSLNLRADVKGMHDYYPIQLAATREIVEYLVDEMGADIHIRAFELPSGKFLNSDALWIASQQGNADVVRALCERGANVNGKGANDVSPLWIACEYGNLDVVRVLCEHRACVECKGAKDVSPLWISAQNGHHEIVQFLLGWGADVNMLNRHGVQTALWIAAARNRLPCVQVLLRYGAQVNEGNRSNGRTPLFIAAMAGHLDMVMYLVTEASAQINLEDRERYCPICIAKKYHHTEVVRFLTEVEQNTRIEYQYDEKENEED